MDKTNLVSPTRGFTLMELMVVMAIIASLMTLALPRYFHSVDRSREAILRQDLHIMRDAIDKFLADRGRYPLTLEEIFVALVGSEEAK